MPPGADAGRLRTRDAIALGLLHGPAELLPVSSSAHITLVPWLLGWPYATLDAELRKRFEVALHAGAVAGLLLGLRDEVAAEVVALDGRRARVLLLSTLPPALAGLACERTIERRLGTPRSIAAGLAAGALALAVADATGGTGRVRGDARDLDGLLLGVAQACALYPGVSRNGATLTAARGRGFARADASVLSRHVALPVIAGATGLKLARLARSDRARSAPDGGAFVAGTAAAFVSSLAAIPIVRAVDRGRSLLPFAAYRIALAALVLTQRRRRRCGPRRGGIRRPGPKSILHPTFHHRPPLHNRTMASPVGTLLSQRYRLDAKVGTGGMSTVYRAFDTVLERQVAIKLMHREIAGDSDQLERFRREARAVAQLNHPHVVGVIDAGEEEGGEDGFTTPYIVFEYVEGETLKDRIRRNGRLPVSESIAYAIEIARALGAAHASHIVHRDVKPQNVLVDEEGAAKVTDFGIARSLLQEGLTADGRVLGTTDYVSPEQALGHVVSGQSDLYSLGIVMFEMLTGDVPFKGENQVAVAMKHVREDLPDVQVRRPEVSAALASVLDRATAKDLDRRYPDAATLIADLEDVLAIETSRTGQVTGEATAVLRSLPEKTRRRLPLRTRRSTKAIVALVVVIAAIAVVVTVLLGLRQTERGTGKRATVTPPAGLQEVPLRQRAARDFDPLSEDKAEHPDEASSIVDGDPQSTWSTEGYSSGDLQKDGVGIVIDAAPDVAARQLELRTPTTGFEATVYVSDDSTPDTAPPDGWTAVSATRAVGSIEKFDLDTAGQRFRHYLVWITKLPEGAQRAEISEILLYR